MTRQTMLALLAGLTLPAAAGAQQPGYVGNWASEASWCRNKLGTTDEIPLRVSARGVEGFEFRCSFDRVSGKDGRWDVTATCQGEGMTEKRRIRLVRDGDAMTWSERGKDAQRLVRCR